MAGFSSDPQLSLRTSLHIDTTLSLDPQFLYSQEIETCLEWIKKGGYRKVCLQFPDSLLVDSVDIALFIERRIAQKVYVLGDTSYGSCCVDEIAAEHVNGDAIIHFGQSCLSPVGKLPVHYVLPKEPLDVPKFYLSLGSYKRVGGPVLLLYDVAFAHKSDELRDSVPEGLKGSLVVSAVETGGETKPCSSWCDVLKAGVARHTCSKLSRSYCPPPGQNFDLVVYLGDRNTPNLKNFLCAIKGVNFVLYSEGKLEPVSNESLIAKTSYLVERLKDSRNIGILAGTLGIKGYLEAIEHVKKLARRFKKKTYVIVVGKPSPPKLANFPEMDIFVAIACPEAEFGDRKNYIQPIVGLFEVELAFNEKRTWDSSFSRYFRDLLPGGNDYIPCPESEPDEPSSISLVSSKMHGMACSSDSTELTTRPGLQLGLLPANTSYTRTWNGLERGFGETPVTPATGGRAGVPAGYQNELLLAQEEEKRNTPGGVN